MNAWTERRQADVEAEALLTGRATATALLEVAPLVDELRARYADRPAPTPSSELEQVFAWGLRTDDEAQRAPAIAWLPGRPRERAPMWTPRRRVVVALLAATIALGGLAVAGAVPAVRDAIADAAEVFGLDLPRSSPEAPGSPVVTTSPGTPTAGAAGAVAPAAPGAGSAPSVSAPGSSSSSATTTPSNAPPTTVPAGGEPRIDVPGIDVPPITVPIIDVPPITVPIIDVPPIDLPPITVPPIDLPPITLPPLPPLF